MLLGTGDDCGGIKETSSPVLCLHCLARSPHRSQEAVFMWILYMLCRQLPRPSYSVPPPSTIDIYSNTA